ncbi:hypothetical protein AXX12_17145 [Anaerosporomusa subterranea]|uniref:Preprotein translocase subunit SecA n=1 Tax=Anaerosporomusa subterranea TaxID=1794912 RepID=A0A154BV27_ANASB|nr:SEC-C domain-containing protein [Anaerosporomusa subterranea]KYZ77791.1 hypothetical protein AXX12_17145 [Anaerosporomusa subterranea]
MGILKSDGLNESERLLNVLCHKSFLSLWTYSNLFRDQGKKNNSSDGKEVCDAIAVFGEHIIIFSDKSCAFPNTGSLEVDWGRWYRSAIKKSVDQLLGAKRWIKQYPSRLFIDRSCSEPFPIQLPPSDRMKFHLIAVARGAGVRCRQHYGGSGSLMLVSSWMEQLMLDKGENLSPFSVGALAHFGEYVHVLDDVTTEIVLNTLDTAPDLIRYLTEKERFVTSRRFQSAAGEEELLAFYMQSWNEQGDFTFVIPSYQPPQAEPGLVLAEGLWVELTSSPDWYAMQEWRRPSCSWDKLIDTFAFHTLDGSLYEVEDSSPKYQETLLRFLSAEHRNRRQTLSLALLGQLVRAPKDENVYCSARVVVSRTPAEPSYVFLVVGLEEGETPLDYRKRRRSMLSKYCVVTKHLYPNSEHIIGIGIEPKDIEQRSEDMIYLDATEWTSEMASHAAELHMIGILKKLQQNSQDPMQYIHARLQPDILEKIAMENPGRNDPCPCGSGVKFKKCHGAMM